MMKTGSVWRVMAPADATMKELVGETVWNLKLIHAAPPPTLPKGDPEATTSTKSGLQFERLSAGTGDRPRDRFICQLDWDFWKVDGTYVADASAGELLMGRVAPGGAVAETARGGLSSRPLRFEVERSVITKIHGVEAASVR